MRTLILLAASSLLGPVLAQQIPIPAFGNTFSSATLTRGFWFQAPINFVITGARVPDETNNGIQNVEIIDFGLTAPPVYAATATGTQLFYSVGQPSANILPCSVSCVAGNYYGVLGSCGTTTMYNSYATPAGPFASNVLGTPMTITRFGTQFNINTTGGNHPCWTEPGGAISRVELYVGGPGYASATPYGTGCYSVADTCFYENFGVGTFDLANSAMTLLHVGNSYLALPGLTQFVPPSAAATTLALADNAEVTVALGSPMPVGVGGSTSNLTVCSNGFVSVASGNGIVAAPVVATFLNAPRTGWWCWHNFNPAAAGGGQVKFEQTGGVAYITWDGVWDSGGTTAANASRFQFQFELATGTVHLVWQTMSNLGTGYLVGFSEGGNSPNPGNTNISAALPATFSAATFRVLPLAHGATARPVIGTTIALQTTNVPAGSPLGATILSLTEITGGIDLTSIGAPGCSQYLTPASTLIFFPAGGMGSLPFAIPNSPGLAGVTIVSQGATLTPGVNAIGVLTSNGLRLLLDLL